MQNARLWLERINGIIVSLAVLAAAMMMVQVTLDVLCKYLFNFPIPLTLEAVASFYMVALIFLPLGLVTRDRGHIGVDLFTRNMPMRGRAALDAFASLLGAVYSALLLYFTTLEAMHQTRIGETWETAFGYVEIWPARWLVPLGCILMLVWFLVLLIEDLATARGRDTEASDMQS